MTALAQSVMSTVAGATMALDSSPHGCYCGEWLLQSLRDPHGAPCCGGQGLAPQRLVLGVREHSLETQLNPVGYP
jgi:hypothetical protein